MSINDLKARFTDLRLIKRGGQKVVFSGITQRGKHVVLKIVHSSTDERVLQEIELLKRLTISNIPTIHETGTIFDEDIKENILYIVEDFIEGESLREWIKRGNIFTLKEAFDVLSGLLEILVELEKNAILHRDINPNNIILTNDNEVFLIDFGLAKDLTGLSITMTGADQAVYTPGYAPHEQIANMRLKQDVRTDLFQIGVTIYEACTGKNPFVEGARNWQNVMDNTVTLIPAILSIPGDRKGLFGLFIDILMAKNQSQRPDTAADALRYLHAIENELVLE